jgi:phytanoyl-CoA hydroxylase
MDSCGVAESQLSAGEIAQFGRDGYVIARALADPRLCERMKAIAQDHVAREVPPVEYEADLGYPGAPQSRTAEGGRTVRRLLQACSREPLYRQWATSAPLRGCLAQLLGGQVMLVEAHHNCIMTKHPQYGSETGWHRDIRYWSFERPDLISVWLALGTEREQNGGLWIVPGSHALNFDSARFDDALFLREDQGSNRALLDQRVPVELNQGDVLFFHCRLLHSAGRNRSSETKYSVVFTYCDKDNRAIADTRSASLPIIALPLH